MPRPRPTRGLSSAVVRLLQTGRQRSIDALHAVPGRVFVDTNASDGSHLSALAKPGVRVYAVASREPERNAIARRLRSRWGHRVTLDEEPYGSHARYQGRINGILMAYSLATTDGYEAVIARAYQDLLPGGRISVVDFLDASGPLAPLFRAAGTALGHDRLSSLRRTFPEGRTTISSLGLWQTYSFVGTKPESWDPTGFDGSVADWGFAPKRA